MSWWWILLVPCKTEERSKSEIRSFSKICSKPTWCLLRTGYCIDQSINLVWRTFSFSFVVNLGAFSVGYVWTNGYVNGYALKALPVWHWPHLEAITTGSRYAQLCLLEPTSGELTYVTPINSFHLAQVLTLLFCIGRVMIQVGTIVAYVRPRMAPINLCW